MIRDIPPANTAGTNDLRRPGLPMPSQRRRNGGPPGFAFHTVLAREKSWAYSAQRHFMTPQEKAQRAIRESLFIA
jgi:hypothetical protein